MYTVTELTWMSGVGYADLATLIGYAPGYSFQPTQLLKPDQAAAVIDGLGIGVVTADETADSDRSAAADSQSLAALGMPEQLISLEDNRVHSTSYETRPGTIVVHREEAHLVRRFLEKHGEHDVQRIRAQAGISDIYLPISQDLIEAKSRSDIGHVRQALAQLLDYSSNTSLPLQRMSALFPSRPIDRGIDLLHRYGIDCVYYDREAERFARLRADPEVFTAVRAL